MTWSRHGVWGVLVRQRLLLKSGFTDYSLVKLSWLPMEQDCMRNVLRHAPLPNMFPAKKRFWKEKSSLMKTNPSSREACEKFNKPRFQFPLYKQMQHKIFQQSSWVFLSVYSITVVIALLFSNALVFQRVICPECFFDNDLFFPAWNISALIQEWVIYIRFQADSSLSVTLQL